VTSTPTDDHSEPPITPPPPPVPDDGGQVDRSHEAAAAAAAAAAASHEQQNKAAKRTKRHSALESMLPIVTGILLTVALQLVIANVVPPEAYLYRLFRPPGDWVMSLVPGLIVFILVWTLVDLTLKYRDGLTNEGDLDRREIRQLPRMVAQEPVGVTQRRLVALEGRDRPVVRRMLWLLHYLESNADAQRTHELLRHQSDLDADTAAASYRTAKLFIWAMPILGFVGTVLGISLAVGGFSQFLTSSLDIEDVSSVTTELGNVASGLSFAFDTTLLGLLAGLVANVMSSIVQKRDERFFTRLDELGLGIVANRQSASTGPGGAGMARSTTDPNFEAAMQARIEEIGMLVDRTRQVMQGLSETSARMNAGLGESMAAVRLTIQSLGKNLEGVSEELTGTMSGLGDSMGASHDRLNTGLSGLQDAVDRTNESARAGAETQATIEEAVQKLSTSIAELGEGLSKLREEQDMLGPVLEQLAGPLELRLVPGRPRAGGGTAD
jgi:biopolymer transport protein ExbB/TolQ